MAAYQPALHRFAVFVAVATFFLIIAGGLVTSTGSGLAVPDWPLSYGKVMPPMVGGILYEHGHRMVATFVGMLTVVLAVWLSRKEPRAWMRRLGWAALGTVVTQGILGGMTVLFLLPTAISVFHACLAQAFFCLTVAIAYFTSREGVADRLPFATRPPRSLATLGVAVVATVYLQLIAGALVRHTGAATAIPDFPLALGRIVPPFETAGVVIQFAHRAGAVAVAVLVVWLAVRAFSWGEAKARGLAGALVALTAGQILLGGWTVLRKAAALTARPETTTGWSEMAVTPATAHVAVGALVLALAVWMALRALRFALPEGRGAEATRSESAPLRQSEVPA